MGQVPERNQHASRLVHQKLARADFKKLAKYFVGKEVNGKVKEG